jgi:hypothetical protein
LLLEKKQVTPGNAQNTDSGRNEVKDESAVNEPPAPYQAGKSDINNDEFNSGNLSKNGPAINQNDDDLPF